MLFEFFKKKIMWIFRRSTVFPVCGFFVHNSQIGVMSNLISYLELSLACPRDLKSGNRKKHPIAVLTFSISINILWELQEKFLVYAENLEFSQMTFQKFHSTLPCKNLMVEFTRTHSRFLICCEK